VQTAPCYTPSFWHNTGVWRTDGGTDGQTGGIASTAACNASVAARCKKTAFIIYIIWNHQNHLITMIRVQKKMTILESLQNSREFPYGWGPAAVGMLIKNFEYFDSRSSISPSSYVTWLHNSAMLLRLIVIDVEQLIFLRSIGEVMASYNVVDCSVTVGCTFQ